MSEFEEVLETIKDFGAEKVILFGSQANNKPKTRNSDYDIAIIKETNQPYHQRLKSLRRRLRTRLPLDLFVFTPSEFMQAKKQNPFVSEIAEKGEVLYAR